MATATTITKTINKIQRHQNEQGIWYFLTFKALQFESSLCSWKTMHKIFCEGMSFQLIFYQMHFLT